MLEKAIKQAVGERAGCVLEIVGHAGITRIEDIWSLGRLTGSVAICGINVNILCEQIAQAYENLAAQPEPDGLDEVEWPESLARHLPTLRENGINTVESVKEAGVDGLSALPGIGKKTAELFMEAVGDKENE